MNAKPLLVLSFLLAALSLGACGGSDETTEAGSAIETDVADSAPEATAGEREEEGGTTESELAPSGEARKADKVEIVGFAYEPDPVVVQVGGKVTWQNEDSAPHTATADDDSFDTGSIEESKIGSASFKEPGTFTYYCTVHPDMHGTVEVVPSG